VDITQRRFSRYSALSDTTFPNLGKIDETDDMRPGLGWAGLEHLQEFVRQGGLPITANDTTNFAVALRAYEAGMWPRACHRRRPHLRVGQCEARRVDGCLRASKPAKVLLF
jgi:hypothetical protein